jgi:hypothetical protein
MSVFHFAVRGGCAVAFRAHTVSIRSQQLGTFASVRFMTGCAALFKYRLVQNFLGLQVRLVYVAVEAHGYRVGFGKSRRLSGMWIVAICAIALGTGMLKL